MKPTPPIYIYVASPYGFAYSTSTFMKHEWYPAIRQAHDDIVLLDPWADSPGRPKEEIGKANFDAIRQCDLLVAGLDGCDVDSGTATEIGFAYALGRPIIGYRDDLRSANDHPSGVINLQTEYAVCANGTIVHTLADLTETIKTVIHSLRSEALSIPRLAVRPTLRQVIP